MSDKRRLAVEITEKPKLKNICIPGDIIVLKKCNDLIEYDEKGNKITRTTYKKVNITKLVNETKKLIKKDLALEKLEELKKAMEANK